MDRHYKCGSLVKSMFVLEENSAQHPYFGVVRFFFPSTSQDHMLTVFTRNRQNIGPSTATMNMHDRIVSLR